MAKIAQELVTAAQAAQRKWKVWASVSLAQYGIESAWGTKEPKGSNNGFGIQRLPGLPFVSAQSFEYKHGVRVPETENFAVFKSVADAFDKHGELIATNKVYAKAMATTNVKDFVEEMAKEYASAPNYATVILGLIRADNLEEYDTLPSLIGATGPTGGDVPPPPKPPILVYPSASPDAPATEPSLHPTFAQELATLFKRWF